MPPEMTSLNALARPRVECSSSLVAWKEGHIVPSRFRHAPTPLHISTARAKPPSLEKSMMVGTGAVL